MCCRSNAFKVLVKRLTMKILVIAPFLPWPLDQGGKIRVFNLLKERAERHDVTLACLTDGQATDPGPLAEICDEIITVPRPPQPAVDLLRFLFSNQPFNILRYRSAAFAAALRDLNSRCQFDQIQIEFSMMWQYVRLFPGAPTLLNAHNVEAEIVRQLGSACHNPLKRLLYRVEEQRLRREEVLAWRECTVCCAVSEPERAVIAAATGMTAKVRAVANGVDLGRFAYLPKTQGDGTVLLLGSMEYAPNLDAATWFIEEILPLLRDISAAVNIVVAGRGLDRIAVSTASEMVQLQSDVADVRPYMCAADLLAVPLRMGAGTRIKILEAMASGLPIVTTSKGCEGLLVKDGEHLLIADTPAEFAQAIIRLLQDRRVALQLAANARNLVEGKYGWETVATAME